MNWTKIQYIEKFDTLPQTAKTIMPSITTLMLLSLLATVSIQSPIWGLFYACHLSYLQNV